jgi:hypothetical protein
MTQPQPIPTPTTTIQDQAPVSLYAIGMQLQEQDHEMLEAADMLASDDPEEVAEGTRILEEMLAVRESTHGALLAKADRVLIFSERLTQQAAARKAILARLEGLVKSDEARAAKLNEYVIKVLTTLHPGQRRFDLDTHELTSRKSTVVELDPEVEEEPRAHLPEDCVQETISYKASKAAIKAALSRGVVISGARLKQRLNWQIK